MSKQLIIVMACVAAAVLALSSTSNDYREFL